MCSMIESGFSKSNCNWRSYSALNKSMLLSEKSGTLFVSESSLSGTCQQIPRELNQLWSSFPIQHLPDNAKEPACQTLMLNLIQHLTSTLEVKLIILSFHRSRRSPMNWEGTCLLDLTGVSTFNTCFIFLPQIDPRFE